MFIHSPTDGHLGGFQFGAITNKSAVSSDVILFLPHNLLHEMLIISPHFTDEKKGDPERSSNLSKVIQPVVRAYRLQQWD